MRGRICGRIRRYIRACIQGRVRGLLVIGAAGVLLSACVAYQEPYDGGPGYGGGSNVGYPGGYGGGYGGGYAAGGVVAYAPPAGYGHEHREWRERHAERRAEWRADRSRDGDAHRRTFHDDRRD